MMGGFRMPARRASILHGCYWNQVDFLCHRADCYRGGRCRPLYVPTGAVLAVPHTQEKQAQQGLAVYVLASGCPERPRQGEARVGRRRNSHRMFISKRGSSTSPSRLRLETTRDSQGCQIGDFLEMCSLCLYTQIGHAAKLENIGDYVWRCSVQTSPIPI